jgi:hypothetical protein
MVASGDPEFPFWVTFAIYFPAVTGILAGINMSGDLADPVRSIPKGTLLAIGVGFLVYLAQILIGGGAFSRVDLTGRPYGVLEDHALLGAGLLVAAGVFAATLSSALGSYLGAPRILQALARDKILTGTGFFRKGARGTDEPRRALVLTGLITVATLLIAQRTGKNALNAVAAVITMFFLYTYGMINFAAFVEAAGLNPSFRPRFRLFHWSTAMMGALACLGVAVLINTGAAVAAVVVVALLYWHIARRELRASFGDARRGYVYASLQRNLGRLAGMAADTRNWRPTVLVFSGNPSTREALVRHAVWLGGGRGIVYLANILIGAIEEHVSQWQMARKQLARFCSEHDIQAFPVVAVAQSVDRGIRTLLHTAAGPLCPNLVAFGWPGKHDRAEDLLGNLRVAQTMGMGLILLRVKGMPEPRGRQRIDIWWRGEKNGGLMLLLAHLLRQNWEWKRSEVRLLRLLENEAGREPAEQALQEMIHRARLDAKPKLIVAQAPFALVLKEHSADAACVFLGLELPPAQQALAWYGLLHEMLDGLPTTILVNSAGEEDLFA